MLRRVALLMGAVVALVACVRLTVVESAPDLTQAGAVHDTASPADTTMASAPDTVDTIAVRDRTPEPISVVVGRSQAIGRTVFTREAPGIMFVIVFAALLVGAMSSAKFDWWRRSRTERQAPARHLLDVPRFLFWRGPPVPAFSRR